MTYYSLSLQPSEPLFRISHFSYTRLSVFLKGEEFIVLLLLLIHRKVHLAQQVLEAQVTA